jgi:MFS family permease
MRRRLRSSIVTPPVSDTTRIPVRYWIWLLGAAVSLLGDYTMTFAIGWSATHYGGQIAGLVLLLMVAPRAILLLIGGAAGDRFGAPRVLLTSCVAMFLLTSALVPASLKYGEPVWLLMVTSLGLGLIEAFFLPSYRAMPRLLVPQEVVPRALASLQVLGVLFAVCGTAIGGLVVGWAGLKAASGLNAITFLVMIGTLVVIRGTTQQHGAAGTRIMRSIADGLKVAFGNPMTRALLIVMLVAYGLLQPMDGLILPLLARDHGWEASTAALLLACRALGVALIALRIMARGAFPRPGFVAPLGLLLAAVGLIGLATVDSLPLAIAAAMVSGIGVGTFTGHLLPLLMNSVQKDYQSRLQSVVVLCQSTAVVIMNPLLGTFADLDAVGITGVCLGIGIASALLGLIALNRPILRTATV